MNKTTTMPRKLASFFLSLALVASFIPAASLLSSSTTTAFASTITVSNAEQFLTALNNASDGDVIDLGGNSIQINAQTDGNDPIVNKVNVTIQNGDLSLRPAGIVQGADLTLKNLTLTFQNSVRNGIFSNGYNTTIENVKKSSSATYSIHVVVGPIVNAQSAYIPSKSTNSKANLTIKGENTLGQIFMGAFDDVANNASTAGFYSMYTPTITVDPACKSVFADAANSAIYACGVSEQATNDVFDNEQLGDIMLPVGNRFIVNSTTSAVNLGGSQVKAVNGETYSGKKLAVNYYGGEYLVENVALNSVGELNVKTGVFKIATGSTFAGSSKALGVSAGATLIAGALGDATFYNFNGGGTLALGEGQSPTQTLTFTGAVSSTTDVVFGNSNGFWKAGVADTVYIKAANSYTTSFTVNNASCIPSGKTWNRNEDGEWSFSSDATEHEHDYGYVSVSDTEHAYECVDPKCPEEDKGFIATEDHDDDNNDNICDACGYEKTEIHDIFTANDSSKLEQFKAKVFNALIKKETSIDVSEIGITPDEVTYSSTTGATALAGMVRSHPLFSTLCVGWGGFSFQTVNGKITTVDVTYYDLTWKIEDLRKFIKAYDECMSRILADATEFQKAAIIHDWVCEHVSYSLGADKADFALGAIYNGKAVCGGYSQAYQFLCQQAGLECNYITGTTTKEAHAWNKVKVSGQWFLVDTTWDRGLTTSVAFSHAYFMCNDDEFKTAGDGGHAGDTNVEGDGPSNTEWYFANKFWEDKTGVLSADQLKEDPQLTLYNDCERGNHTWGEWQVTKEATCETEGSKTRTCSVCNETETESISALGHTSDSGTITKAATCETAGTKTYKCKTCGATIKTESIKATGHKWNAGLVTKKPTRTTYGEKTYTCTVCKKTKVEKIAKIEAVNMYRLYNPNSGEHFYTSNSGERDNLKRLGWVYEGVGWIAPKSSKTPVHRLYNPNAGDHHYTTSDSERDMLKRAGWIYEGVGWYSDDSKTVPLYRQYNPNAKAGSHNFTTSESENEMLKKAGWIYEGIAWHGMN